MTLITIPAQVVNGHLQHERSLPEYEGQRVIATLTVVAEDSNSSASEKAPPRELIADLDPAPPSWLEIEHDLYFPMTVPSVSLGIMKIKVEAGKPCIILPDREHLARALARFYMRVGLPVDIPAF